MIRRDALPAGFTCQGRLVVFTTSYETRFPSGDSIWSSVIDHEMTRWRRCFLLRPLWTEEGERHQLELAWSRWTNRAVEGWRNREFCFGERPSDYLRPFYIQRPPNTAVLWR